MVATAHWTSLSSRASIRSIALPPLGAGNGQLDWPKVRVEIQRALSDLEGVDIVVYEPTEKYQNVAKRTGVDRTHAGTSAYRGDDSALLGARN